MIDDQVTTYEVTMRVTVSHNRRRPPRTLIRRLVDARMTGTVGMCADNFTHGRLSRVWVRGFKVRAVEPTAR